jgi:hypothetical protein
MPENRKCKKCERNFISRRGAIYCSIECAYEARYESRKKEKPCVDCGSFFISTAIQKKCPRCQKTSIRLKKLRKNRKKKAVKKRKIRMQCPVCLRSVLIWKGQKNGFKTCGDDACESLLALTRPQNGLPDAKFLGNREDHPET